MRKNAQQHAMIIASAMAFATVIYLSIRGLKLSRGIGTNIDEERALGNVKEQMEFLMGILRSYTSTDGAKYQEGN